MDYNLKLGLGKRKWAGSGGDLQLYFKISFESRKRFNTLMEDILLQKELSDFKREQ